MAIHADCWNRLDPLKYQRSATSEACLDCLSAPAVPGTQLIKKDNSLEDEYELTEDVKDYYRRQFTERERIRDEVGIESSDKDVKVGENLRRRWAVDQATDPELHEDIQRLRKTNGVDDQFKRLKDGLLEVCVKSNYPGEPVIWVPHVPAGEIHNGESWKTWLIRMFHTGIAGAHRSAEKTLTLLKREGYWLSLIHISEPTRPY